MSEGFANDIIGGAGALVRAMLKSPDFVAGSAGWSVNKDGSAEFNNVTIRAGEVVDGTALYYSPSPGPGNLVASIASAFGTDAYGNVYQQGVVTYAADGSYAQITNAELLLNGAPAGNGAVFLTISGDVLLIGSVTPGLTSVKIATPLTATAGTPSALTQISTDSWNAVSLPTGMTGTIRVRLLPLTNLAVLDVNTVITSTQTTAASYTTGNLPSSAYYPAAEARQYDTSVNQKFTTVSNASPRINIPTSGALTFDMPGFATGGLACIVSGTIVYPLD